MKKLILLGGLFCLLQSPVPAQISKAGRTYLEYIVTTTHPDRNYRVGEEAAVRILGYAGGVPLEGVKVCYSVGDEMMPAERVDTVAFRNGEAVLPLGTRREPGFRACQLHFVFDGKLRKDMVKVAYSPEAVKPYTEMPKDFARFWEKALKQGRKVPMNPEVTPMPQLSNDSVEVSMVKLQCGEEGRYVCGYLAKPRKPGKYPVLMNPPGAGVKRIPPTMDYAAHGFITLAIDIHGISPQASDADFAADRKRYGGYTYKGMESPETYYYKNVYLGCVRAIDFLCSLPEFDGKNVGVTGGSQGGALTMVTAALDKRVTFLAAFYPALCDLTGFLHDRAGGWPKFFLSDQKKMRVDEQTAVRTLSYYDVVNFARQIQVPGFYSYGYNDNTCSPTSVAAAINSITAPKTVVITPTSAHWRFPDSNQKSIEWMKAQVK